MGTPACVYYKPAGVPLRMLTEVALGLDELEAIRLADVEGLYHVEAAVRMDVSRQTFDRIVARARWKVATALVSGQAIRIETDAPWGAVPSRPAWREGDMQ
jgi:uncharacterized protein